jgi:hypothetical protein
MTELQERDRHKLHSNVEALGARGPLASAVSFELIAVDLFYNVHKNSQWLVLGAFDLT